MIDMSCTQEMVDTIHGSIAYSGIERAVIGTPIFNRLHRVLQNSLVYLTYPSNKVKRFEHSVGTMHLAGRFFFHSVCNSSPATLDQFFEEVDAELKAWNANPNSFEIHFVVRGLRAKYSKDKILTLQPPKCRLYFQNAPANLDPNHRLGYYVVYQAVRLVGLLHDVGHLPYSHVLEHSLQALYRKVLDIREDERNDAHRYFLDVMEKYCGSDDAEFAIHEELGTRFVDKIFETITDELPKSENPDFYFLAAVLHFTKAILTAGEGVNSLFSDLHRIVAGTLDCDRMDYCCRDEYCSGISKEQPSYAHIFSTVQIVYRKEVPLAYPEAEADDRDRCYFAPSTKALREIEALLRRRWDIYAAINYHHRVHKHELLLEEVLAELGLREMECGERPEELENILPLRVSSIWQLVAQMDNSAPVEYVAIQLDDSWLDTLLKHKYFELYGQSYLSFSENGSDVMWHRLDELISAQKHYCSLIKRSGGFRQFDEYAYNELMKTSPDGLLDSQEGEKYTQYVNDGGEYLLNRALRVLLSSRERGQFFLLFNQRVRALVHEKDNPYHIVDCFLADSSFSMGIRRTDPLYITAPAQKEKTFVGYSAILNNLTSEKKLLPSFHIYYLPEYDTAHSEYMQADTTAFLKAAAREAVDVLLKLYSENTDGKE